MRTDDIIEAIADADNTQTLFSAVETFAHQVGMDGAYLINFHPAKGLTCLDDRPKEWLNFYNKEGYVHIDPVTPRAFRGGKSFTWEECIESSNLTRDQKMLLMQARDFDLNQGYNTVSNRPDYSASTCCFYNRSSKDFLSSLRHFSPHMDMVGAAAQEKIALLIENTIEIERLSPREEECLVWASRSKTNDEIGTILGISENTVNGYIQSASRKLKVRGKTHAVVKAIQLRLIFPF